MADRISSFITWFNRQNTALIIFILCMANFFGLTLESGEEQYFAFARQFADPDWMPHSFTLNHPAGGNLAFQVIIGFFLKFITFEQMAAWGRSINFLLLAIPLGLIVRKLKITNVALVFILQVIFFGHQALYAGEWIFKNLEEKSVAYIFVFWSILFLLNEKPVLSAVFAALGTWFHFLVGGWMFCFVFLYFVIRTKSFKTAAYTGTVYILITLPLIVYLYRTYFIDNPSVIDGVNTSVIYSFWRLKHHVGMFRDAEYFIKWSLWGVILTLIMLYLCAFVFSGIKDRNVRKLNLLNIIIFSQQSLFMILSVFDRNGVLGKTYPFRTNSISFLLFLFECSLIAVLYFPLLYQRLSGRSFDNLKEAVVEKAKASFSLIILLVAFIVFMVELGITIKDLHSHHGDVDESMLSLISYVRHNTPEKSVFMFVDGDRPYSFMRRAERERFVVEKFTPTKSRTIYEWYRRAGIKKRLRDDIILIDSVKAAYTLNYLVSDSLYINSSIVLEREFGKHKLYRVME